MQFSIVQSSEYKDELTLTPPRSLCGQKVKGDVHHRTVRLPCEGPFPCPLLVLALWVFPLSPLPMDFLNIDFLKEGREADGLLIRWPRRNRRRHHYHYHHHRCQTPCDVHERKETSRDALPRRSARTCHARFQPLNLSNSPVTSTTVRM